MKTLNHHCHREFLNDYIYEHFDSIDSFLRSTKAKCSKSSLSHFFKKNHAGRYLKNYSFKIDTWADLITSLDITPLEVDFLIALKINEDFSLKYSSKSPQKVSSDRILATLKHASASSYDKLSGFSSDALNVGKIYDLLPASFKRRMLKEVMKVSSYYLGGKAKAKTAPIIRCLEDLPV